MARRRAGVWAGPPDGGGRRRNYAPTVVQIMGLDGADG